jgi:hypothetical protein
VKGTRSKIPSMTALLFTSVAMAQKQSAPIDLAVTYDALRTNHITA